jgi:hypothetical protein
VSKENDKYLEQYRRRYPDIASSPELDRRLMAGLDAPLRAGVPLDDAVDLVASEIREGVRRGAINSATDEQEARSAVVQAMAHQRSGGRL